MCSSDLTSTVRSVVRLGDGRQQRTDRPAVEGVGAPRTPGERRRLDGCPDGRIPGDGEATAGALNAAIGAGGFIGAIVAGVLVLHRRQALPLLAGAIIMGISCAGLGLAGAVPVAIVAMAFLSIGALLASIVVETLFQRIVPDEVRGRALGFAGTIRVIAMMAGSLVIPPLAGAIGVDIALYVSGAVIVLSTVVAVGLLGSHAVQSPAVDARIRRLAALPMMAGLPPARIEAAERHASVVPVRAGDVVIRQDDPADRFYVIAEGEVEVTQAPPDGGPAVVLRRMGPGEGFGEIGLLAGSPRTATVTAVADGALVALDGDRFLELVSGAGMVTPFIDQVRGPIHPVADAGRG